MEYRDGHFGGDQLGGVPSHLPYNWPQCQSCHEEMAFLAQIYACDWFTISGYFCLQFYLCDRHCAGRPFLHLERVRFGAARNQRRLGRVHAGQARKTIRYVEVEDSVDQMHFTRNLMSECELPDKHLREDKLGGLFPYDGAEGPELTEGNRCIGQMNWKVVPFMVYLYESADRGPYLFLYS